MSLTNKRKSLDVYLNEFHYSEQRGFGNSGPIGLFAFGTTQLIYSLYLIQIANITNRQVWLGASLFYGGVIQVLAGLCEFYSGKTLSATLFCSYGGHWISFGFIHLPSSGIIDSFKDDQVMLRNAIGIYHTVWTIFTFLMLIASLRTTVLQISTLLFVFTTFIFLDVADFTGLSTLSRIGGCFGGRNFRYALARRIV
ncbi:28724_t:CDS:2 [Racocetra persica]|uniref:28724_t:CDS:1 n=1 Tax=Racocetra persica TaxID=160502 RepID=A0ACA9KUM2_9GLOM|nr:28724_t:CDS:2 [Racocetra persica]